MLFFISILFICTIIRFILYFIYSYNTTNLGAKIFSIIIDCITIIVLLIMTMAVWGMEKGLK